MFERPVRLAGSWVSPVWACHPVRVSSEARVGSPSAGFVCGVCLDGRSTNVPSWTTSPIKPTCSGTTLLAISASVAETGFRIAVIAPNEPGPQTTRIRRLRQALPESPLRDRATAHARMTLSRRPCAARARTRVRPGPSRPFMQHRASRAAHGIPTRRPGTEAARDEQHHVRSHDPSRPRWVG